MSDEKLTQEKTDATPEKQQESPKETADSGAPASTTTTQDSDKRPRRRSTQKRNFRSRAPRRERVKPEFDQKIISIRRVTRVMAGGRRFSFSVAMVIGDRNGRVGLGTGKANDTSLAIQKAVNDAKHNMIKLDLTDTKSIKHDVDAKYKSARIAMHPNGGRGLVAGSSVRTILEFAGIDHTTTRVLSRSRNKLNNARAAMKALEPFVIGRGETAHSKTHKSKVDNTSTKETSSDEA